MATPYCDPGSLHRSVVQFVRLEGIPKPSAVVSTRVALIIIRVRGELFSPVAVRSVEEAG